tara:strand:- start:337 stop:1107 length:771 start_codon:yes stop_codon:yes gene_type:complete
MQKKHEFKEILVSHFNKQGNKAFEGYGSSSFLKSWQEPYLYMEKYFNSKNLEDCNFLDYCCGTGVHSIYPAKLGAQVTGIDFSSSSIESAVERAKFFNVEDKCQFLLQDAEESISFRERFDFIICVQSLLYLDLSETFKKLSKLLTDQGELIIIESVAGNYFFDLNRIKNVKNISPKFSSSLNKLHSKEIINNAEKSFKILKEDYFGFTTTISYLIERKFKVTIFNKFFFGLDYLLKKIPFLKKYFFTMLIILKKI